MKKLVFNLLLIGIVLTGCKKDDETSPVTIGIGDLTQLSVDENSPNGTVVGNIFSTVENSNETPDYSITSQNPSGSISLNGNEIIVADSSLLNYETLTEITGEINGTIDGVTSTASFIIKINNVDEVIDFPDAKFKAALLNNGTIDKNIDLEITESEALSFTGIISASNLMIQDVTGIEYFTNVTRIHLLGNSLKTIDLSKNTKVTQLLLESNELTSIDISTLTVLTDFKCHSNELTSANIANGNNSNMTRMELQGNDNLTCITVDQLPAPTIGWSKGSKASYSTDCNVIKPAQVP